MTKETAWKWIDENKDRLTAISDKIWGYAELGLMETRSSKLLSDTLESHGFRVERGVAGMPTAFIATYGKTKPVIGVMGEFDALPGISNKPVPHKEWLVEDGPGHGCGHHIHGTSGTAAAIAIRYWLEETGHKGSVKFFGTPAEENFMGKVYMARAGLFDDVEMCMSHHPDSINAASMGSSTAVNNVKFEFFGKTAHAAGSPEQGRSALDGVELMNIGVNYLREHVIQEARFHYVIEEGGGQPNVVPDYARSWYYIRAPEKDQLEAIYKRIIKIAEGAAMMTETQLKVDFISGLYNLIPNKVICETLTENMNKIGAPQFSKEEKAFAAEISKTVSRESKLEDLRRQKVPDYMKYADLDMAEDILPVFGEDYCAAGSTDVGDISWITPTVEMQSAMYPLGSPAHSWQWTCMGKQSSSHKMLVFTAKTMAGTGIDFITKPELLQKAKDEHKQRLGKRKYVSPIPAEIQPPLAMAAANWEKNKGKQ